MMNRIKYTAAVLLLLAACAYKLPEAQVLKIFDRHSFKECPPEKLRSLLREKGLAGLKQADRHAEVVLSAMQVKVSRAKPGVAAGILVGAKGGNYYLLRVFKGSPAEAAGFKDGDKVLAINSYGPGSAGFLQALAGKPDFKIKIARRSGASVREFEAEVEGAAFPAPLIFGVYEPEARTAFVRIGIFSDKSASIAAAGLAGLKKMGAKNVILDLRGNKIGSPEEAAGLLKLFAAKAGPVLAINSRHKGYTHVFEAAGRGRFAGLKAAVLVDKDTAMTGEVFAAAFRELAGAAVIGAKTAGEVSVQRVFALGEGRGLNITVARLAPPSGQDLEGAGLAPDSAAGTSGPAWASVPADALFKDAAYLRALEILSGKP